MKVDRPVGVLKPAVEQGYAVELICDRVEVLDGPVELLENDALHSCMRRVSFATFTKPRNSAGESHPQVQLTIAAIGEGMFVQGTRYKVTVEGAK